MIFALPILAAAAVAAPGANSPDEPVMWTVSGCAAILAQVNDAATGAPLAGARVDVLPREGDPEASPRTPHLSHAGRTSAEGTIVLPPPGASRLVVSHDGFATAEVETPCSDAISVLDISLHALAPGQAGVGAAGDAHRVMAGDELYSTAGTPRNLFQAVESSPSVTRPTFSAAVLDSIFGTGDLGVRGARPGESRTFLDGIEIPYYYHYAALSSVIPAEMVDTVDFVPGGAGAEYGRLDGGVLNVTSRAAREEDYDEPWHGRGTMTFWEANAIARGPVDSKSELSISDRFSFMNLIEAANPNGWGNGSPVWGYDDYQVVYKRALSPGRELDALAFGSVDSLFFVTNPTTVHTEFYRAGATYKAWSARSSGQLSASWGYDRYLLRLLEPGQGVRMRTEQRNQELRLDARGATSIHDVPLRGGVELHGERPMASLALDWEQQEWFLVDRTFTDRGIWGGVWAEADVRPIPQISIIPGVRGDYDSLVGRGWFDPRVTVRWFADEATTVSGSAGIYHRPYPFAVAFADSKLLGLTNGEQYSLGAEHRFGSWLDVDVRGYHGVFRKQVQGVEWVPQFDQSAVGDARSWGAEGYLRADARDGRTRATLGVSAGRTTWKNVSTETTPGDPTTIHWTSADLDSTYGVVLMLGRELKRNWTFGLRSRFYTGLPYTAYDADVFVPDANGYQGIDPLPWGRRAPSFFQTDIRFDKHWQTRGRESVELFFDVENVTNHHNVDSLNTSTGKPTDPSVSSSMPLFPSMGLSVTF